MKCDVALPCATQNELDLDDAKQLVANGVKAVCEGANMPTTLEATQYFQNNGVMVYLVVRLLMPVVLQHLLLK